MMKRLMIPLMTLALLQMSPSPASEKADTEPKPDERPAMVYGSIAGVAGMKHVYIQKLGKVYVGRINRPDTEILGGGAFYFDDVPPGDYYLAGFSRNGELFWFRYTKETVKEVLFPVEPGGLHFMGSYQVKDVSKKGLLSGRGNFDIEVVDSPAETEILKLVAPEVKGTEWASRVEARLQKVSAASTE